jgi:hypothetical protein
MPTQDPKLLRLRQMITENLHIELGTGESLPYIDVSNVLVDI